MARLSETGFNGNCSLCKKQTDHVGGIITTVPTGAELTPPIFLCKTCTAAPAAIAELLASAVLDCGLDAATVWDAAASAFEAVIDAG